MSKLRFVALLCLSVACARDPGPPRPPGGYDQPEPVGGGGAGGGGVVPDTAVAALDAGGNGADADRDTKVADVIAPTDIPVSAPGQGPVADGQIVFSETTTGSGSSPRAPTSPTPA